MRISVCKIILHFRKSSVQDSCKCFMCHLLEGLKYDQTQSAVTGLEREATQVAMC